MTSIHSHQEKWELARKYVAIVMSFVMAFSSMPAVPVFADEAQDLPAVEEEVGEDAPVSEVDESEVVPQGPENSEESSQLEKNVDE